MTVITEAVALISALHDKDEALSSARAEREAAGGRFGELLRRTEAYQAWQAAFPEAGREAYLAGTRSRFGGDTNDLETWLVWLRGWSTGRLAEVQASTAKAKAEAEAWAVIAED